MRSAIKSLKIKVPTKVRQIAPYEPRAVSVYNNELLKITIQMLFELFILILLLIAIHLTSYPFLYFIALCVTIKTYFTWNERDLIVKGKLTYLAVEEWSDLN